MMDLKMKYCKVISTYFGPRHRRLYEIGWPGHGQQISGGESCLFNLKFSVDIEKNLDAGVSYDTIIVNQDNDYEEGNSWLESINGMETRCGRIYCISRENTGRNFAAYRYGYETFKNDYDFFMFIPDDHIMMAKNYYRESIKRYNKKIEEDNCAVLALTGTGIINDDQTIHAHDGISLIHKKYIEEHYEKIGPLAAATSAKNVISDNYEGTGIILEHVTGGEIPFTNNFIKLGYKIVSFDGIHDCVEIHSSSLTKLEKYKTWRYNKGMSCRGGGWPIELNGEIFCAPIYNLLSDHPGGINISDFKIDESISTIVYKEL